MGQVALHWTYFEMVAHELVAIDQCVRVEAVLNNTIDATPAPANRDELIDILYSHYGQRRRHSILKVMIVSAMALEAYINNVAKQRLQGFDREALDKLDLAAKWVLIPRLAFGRGPDAGSDLIARIKDVQKERNFLAHAKPVKIPCDGTAKMRPLDEKRARVAWQTCLDALAEIRIIDPTFEQGYFDHYVGPMDAIRERAERAMDFESKDCVSGGSGV